MKLRSLLFAAVAAASISGTARGASTLNLYFGALRDALGATLPDETLVVLIANTDGGAGLPGGLTTNLASSGLDPSLAYDHFAGQTLAVGGSVNSDIIFYVGSVNGLGLLGSEYAGTVVDSGVSVTYAGGLSVGQTFGLYWFPGLTPATNTVPAAAFQIGGFHNPDPNVGDIGMILPSDGAFVDVFQVDATIAALDGASSNISDGAFTAIVAIPEPASALLLAAGGAFLLRRRRG
jgi:hypothetical protein